jgi:hypothetical protein
MRDEGEMMKIFFDFIGGFEDERVDEVRVLRTLEYCSGEMSEESIK